MLGQATSRGQVADGIRQYGVAPGGRKMIDMEAEAAQMAIETGMYVTWRSRTGTDCTRVGPQAKCFCGHTYQDHIFVSKKAVYPRCTTCACQRFAFIPQRPEEVGDWWLPRRKGFNVHTWRAKCRCGHGHDEHDPNTRRCMCGCAMFQSNFACVVCDLKWEDHETVFETTQERLAEGRPVGDEFRPLASDPDIQRMVFPGLEEADVRIRARGGNAARVNKERPVQVEARLAEKSVQIMHASSGGVIGDQGVANRWGKVERPPEEWLYKPPGYSSLPKPAHLSTSPRTLEPSGGAPGGPVRPSSRGRDGTGSQVSQVGSSMRPVSRGRTSSTSTSTFGSAAPTARPASRGRDSGGGSRPGSRGGDAGPSPMSIVGSSVRPASGRVSAALGPPPGRSMLLSAQTYRGTPPGQQPPSQMTSGFRPVYD